ncbi:hypothetical protein JD969_04735 [Planctomycetota bacterium]|nr:hypothetical protein JD969_04735 [Planctomycetota bacterium]
MTDRYDQDKMLGYIEDTLSDAERVSFEAELAKDDALRKLVEGIMEDMGLLGELPVEKPGIDLVEEVMQQQERNMLLGEPDQPLSMDRDDRGVVGRIRFTKVLSYTAAAAILILCGGVMVATLFDKGLLSDLANEAKTLTVAQDSVENETLAMADMAIEGAAVAKGSRKSLAANGYQSAHAIQAEAEAKADELTKERDRYIAENARLQKQVQALAMKSKSNDLQKTFRSDQGEKTDQPALMAMAQPKATTRPIRSSGQRRSSGLSATGANQQLGAAASERSQTAKDAVRPLVIVPTQRVVALNVDTDSMYATEQQVLRWASANDVDVYKTTVKPERAVTSAQISNYIDPRKGNMALDQERSESSSALAEMPMFRKNVNENQKPTLADRARSFAQTSEAPQKSSEPVKSEDAAVFMAGATLSNSKLEEQPTNQKEIVIEIRADQLSELVRTLKVRRNQGIKVVSKPITTAEAKDINSQIQSQLPLNFIWIDENPTPQINDENWGEVMFQNMPLVKSRPVLRVQPTSQIHLPITITEEVEVIESKE